MSAAGGLHGAVQVVDDPAAAYAEEVQAALAATTRRPFRLAISGGSSGQQCLRALAAAGLRWRDVEIFFVDERCVAVDDERSNAGSLATTLGPLRSELAGWHPMSCEDGPASYERLLASGGPLDLVQLGFGPDGHTASLFPGSPALDAAAGALVVENVDPTGRNPLRRMTLTFEAIDSADRVVIVVTGPEKRAALTALLAGGDLPAGRVRGKCQLWLVDVAAAAGLPL